MFVQTRTIYVFRQIHAIHFAMLIELIKASHASFNWIAVELDSTQPVQSKNQIQSITSQLYIYKKFQSYSKRKSAFYLHPRVYKTPRAEFKKAKHRTLKCP